MRPAELFLAARKRFGNCGKCCKSSTSNKLLPFQNFFHATTKSLHRNEVELCGPRQIDVDKNWHFELSELCRPGEKQVKSAFGCSSIGS